MKDSPQQSRNRSLEKGSEDSVVKTTIVGGRPPAPGRQQGSIPRGIEVLIKKASVDPAFRKILLEKRAEAAHEIALELSLAEVATLQAVPLAQLEKIIANATVPDPQRRIFLGQVGALMLAALTLGLSGCKEVEEIFSNTAGITLDEYPTPKRIVVTPKKPTSTPTLVRAARERLDVKVESGEANSAAVWVDYDCAFETGEITVDFRQSPDVRGTDITYQPAQSLAVSRGSGEVTFHATGLSGTTHWLIVGLCATTAGCRNSPALSPPGEYQSGQYIEGDCAVWKIVEYHQDWPSKE